MVSHEMCWMMGRQFMVMEMVSTYVQGCNCLCLLRPDVYCGTQGVMYQCEPFLRVSTRTLRKLFLAMNEPEFEYCTSEGINIDLWFSTS